MKTAIALAAACSIALLLGAAPATQPTADCCMPTGSMAARMAAPSTQPAGKADAAALFEKLKSLAGTWEADPSAANAGDQCTIEYTLTGGDSVVIETMKMHGGMTTMYTLDHSAAGDRIVMTHYCASGNQPRMVSPGLVAGKSAHFTFLDATGMKTPEDGHMHELSMTFADDGSLTEDWAMYQDGKSAGVVTMKLKKTM